MPINFEIEYVNIANGKNGCYVLARYLTPEIPFSLMEKCFLNGVEIKTNLGLINVRAATANGQPSGDVFIFYLKYRNEIHMFTEKMIVELTTG